MLQIWQMQVGSSSKLTMTSIRSVGSMTWRMHFSNCKICNSVNIQISLWLNARLFHKCEGIARHVINGIVKWCGCNTREELLHDFIIQYMQKCSSIYSTHSWISQFIYISCAEIFVQRQRHFSLHIEQFRHFFFIYYQQGGSQICKGRNAKILLYDCGWWNTCLEWSEISSLVIDPQNHELHL